MKNRRGFLTALSAVSASGLAVAMAAKGRAATPEPQPSSASPQPDKRKAPSAAALALAAAYRAFDARLSDAEIETIAHDIDEYRAMGAALARKPKPLRNSDEPVTRFAAAERIDA